MGRRADFALADVIGDLGTADASGFNPDFYWSEGLQQNLDRRRPLFAAAGTGPFPGIRVEPDVGSGVPGSRCRVGEGPEGRDRDSGVAGCGYDVPRRVPLGRRRRGARADFAVVAGCDAGAPQLVPAGLRHRHRRRHRGEGVGGSDSDRCGARHGGLCVADGRHHRHVEPHRGRNRDARRQARRDVGASGSPFSGLVDTTDRRILSTIGSQNADGSAGLTVRGVDIGGVFVFRDPNVANAFQFNTESLVTHEKAPTMIQANNVPNMGVDMGIIGATVVSNWPAGLYKYTV